ncbi:site-specific integrase [Myxococcota bacterium]|nr:site-specific integrase [Myxococcota bacterium]
MDAELQAWIERRVPPERRMRGGLLFENARGQGPSRRWTPTSLHRHWETACRAVGLTAPISLYEGTKHTFATNAKRRGVEDRLLQRFLGHRDRRSVERYARLADEALVAVLRPRRPTPEGDDLSPACRQEGERSRKARKPQRKMVEAAGIEPGTRPGKELNRRDLPAGVAWILRSGQVRLYKSSSKGQLATLDGLRSGRSFRGALGARDGRVSRQRRSRHRRQRGVAVASELPAAAARRCCRGRSARDKPCYRPSSRAIMSRWSSLEPSPSSKTLQSR